jgi:hypothetical protein
MVQCIRNPFLQNFKTNITVNNKHIQNKLTAIYGVDALVLSDTQEFHLLKKKTKQMIFEPML